MARNLRQNRAAVTVFSQRISDMRGWFPGIEPELRLALVDKSNCMTPLPGLRHRQHALRVAIHPTASTTD